MASINKEFYSVAHSKVLQTEHIIMRDLPLPPSSNGQYKLFRRGAKTYHVPSNELKAFKQVVESWPILHPSVFMRSASLAHSWIREGLELEFHAIFYFKKSRIYCKNGKPRKIDVSNRIKSLHDCISKILSIDDCHFFRISAEKKAIGEGEQEGVAIDIYPIARM